MTEQVKYRPEGYHTVTPYLVVRDAEGLMKFVKQVFHAEEVERMEHADGRIRHAELRIGDSIIMLGEALDDSARMPAMLYLYLEDITPVYQRALAAGARSLREPTDEFYGDRSAAVEDRFGNQWWLATHIEDVPAEELQRRLQD